MNSEKEKIYYANAIMQDFNEKNLLKPYGYQNLISDVVDRHLSTTEFGIGEVIGNNLSWVLVSLSLEIKKPVELHNIIKAQTWHVNHSNPIFRRDFAFYNDQNDLLFHGATFSVLLNLTNRSIFRGKEMPFQIMEGSQEFTIEATSKFREKYTYSEYETRKVRNSFLDPIGHVNNCRYGEIAYDAFTESERKNLFNLNRIDLYFQSEMHLNDVFTVSKAYDDQKIIIQIYNLTKEKISFTMVFTFK